MVKPRGPTRNWTPPSSCVLIKPSTWGLHLACAKYLQHLMTFSATGLFLFEALLEYYFFQLNKVSSLFFLSSITFDIVTKVDLHRTMEQNKLTVIGSRPSSTLQGRRKDVPRVEKKYDQKNISATVGESVTLPCRAPDNSIRAILWSRPDLEPKYILLYRDKQIDPEEQHPSFKSRVDLQDRQMEDGDVSLILKDVTINDSGTYECQVFMKGPNQRKRTADYITIINLTVVPDQKIFTAESGQNVTLPCRAPNISAPIRAVEWFRLDQLEGHVLMYREEQFVSFNQLPSFVNRVDLQDRRMKDGDVSLVLKDVTRNDTGTYQCYVIQRGTNHMKSVVEHISIIYLSVVDPPGQTGGLTEDGSVGLKVGLSVFGILVLIVGVVVGFVIFKNTKEQKNEASI
ncbi:junctional adhesion molecule-like isoform X2 [Oreochromis niloticus]|uniref:junctional adhesion molecule-like isoform X2 n=1 Tax=Oreochromis niloticus TaxID=8128 RepID=UPI000DF16B72|nr:junctional adhesion molecule-like isoform X2 [Oreochromis niloticus]